MGCSASSHACPTISIPGRITSHLKQGKKMARDLTLAELRALWQDVVGQVEHQGLALGVHAETPRLRDVHRFLAPPPIVIPPDASEAERLRLRFGALGPPKGSKERE